MNAIRQPAVAGHFYPNSPEELASVVDFYLANAKKDNEQIPKAIVAPHAGFMYSGSIAATAYARLAPAKNVINRVVILGPCHRVAIQGMALPSAKAFSTPLGEIMIDEILRNRILQFPQVKIFDQTHEGEHSLEVHLPFLQRVLNDFTILPVIVGDSPPEAVAQVLLETWGSEETLIVVSSDLSHYLNYDQAREIDAKTSHAIENLAPHQISREGACGRFPVGGLLVAAKGRNMKVETADLRNSGDTAGQKDQVVGYGSWLFFENLDHVGDKVESQIESIKNFAQNPGRLAPLTDPATDFSNMTKNLLKNHGTNLLRIARASIKHGLGHGKPAAVNLDQFPAEICVHGASFITLTYDNKLRGCIGSVKAFQPLVIDVSSNSFCAAFKDPRFSPLAKKELNNLRLSISVLSPQSALQFHSEDDLLRQLRTGIDGLVIADNQHKALFLPSVWNQLPEPIVFVRRLKQKAGLAQDHWSKNLKAWRFVTETICEEEL